MTSRLNLKGAEMLEQTITEHAVSPEDYSSVYMLLRTFVEPRGGRRKAEPSLVASAAHNSEWYLEIKKRGEEHERAIVETSLMEAADAESKKNAGIEHAAADEC